jgi:hypothetical protein
VKILKDSILIFLNPKLTKYMGFWDRHVHAPVIIHPNIQVTSNIYVQNITSTCVTVTNLGDLGVIPDNTQKFTPQHTLIS